MCFTRLKARFAENRFSQAITTLAPITFTRQNLRPLVLTGFSTLTQITSSMIFPILWGQAVADLQDEQDSQVLGIKTTAMIAAGAYYIGYSMSNVSVSLQNWAFSSVGPRAAGKLVVRYLDKFLHRSREEFENESQGKASNLAFKPYMTVSPILTAGFIQIAPALINTSIAATFVAKWNGPSYGLVMTGTVIGLSAFSAVMVPHLVKKRDYQLKTGIKAGEGISFFLTRFPTIQIFGAEEAELKKLRKYVDDDAEANAKINAFQAKTNLGQNIIASMGYGAVIMMGAYGVHTGKISENQFLVNAAYAGSLVGPVTNLAAGTQELVSALSGLKDVISAINTSSKLVDAHPSAELKLLPKDVTLELRKVCFRYQPKPDEKKSEEKITDEKKAGEKKTQEDVLHDIDLKLPAGKKIGLVGASGSGKSTLITLIPRFYDATSGEILIGGTDIKKIGVKHLRKAIAIIPQETALIDGTLRENIAYGLVGIEEEIKDSQIMIAASRAGLDSLIIRHGLDAVVGESGIRLSGGEKQRVAIARALLRKPLLVLGDEVTSALDSRNSEDITAAIDAAFADTTRIFVAHRLDTLLNADLIVVLKEGRVEEQGTHQSLLAINGEYAKLWQKANEKFYASESHSMTLFKPQTQCLAQVPSGDVSLNIPASDGIQDNTVLQKIVVV